MALLQQKLLMVTTPVPVKVYLNRRRDIVIPQINPERMAKDLIYRHIEGGKTLFNIYRRSNKLLQSYVTTGGVPFRPLAEISRLMNLLPPNFVSMLSSGIILDMSLGTYEPVQSRTRLKISDKIDLALKNALFEAYYQNVLQLGLMIRMYLKVLSLILKVRFPTSINWH